MASYPKNSLPMILESGFVVGVAIGGSGDPSDRGDWDCHTTTQISNLL